MTATIRSGDASGAFLFEAQSAYYRYILIRAALDNNIFDLLETPQTATQVAEYLNRDRDIVERLLLVLLAMELVERNGDVFSNSNAASRFCVRSSPESLAGVVLFNDRFFGETLRLQAGLLQPPQEGGQWSPEAFAAGVDASREFLRAGAVEQMLDVLTPLLGFVRCESVLDLGCGAGVLDLEIARMRRDIRVTLVDLPPVLAATRAIVEEYGVADRVTLIGADMFRDAIPGEYDMVLASESLYGAPDLDEFLVRLAGLLKPGGLLVLRHLETAGEGDTAVHDAVLRFGGALVGMPGYAFSPDAVPTAIRRAGLTLLRSRPLPYFGHGYVVHIAERPEGV